MNLNKVLEKKRTELKIINKNIVEKIATIQEREKKREISFFQNKRETRNP